MHTKSNDGTSVKWAVRCALAMTMVLCACGNRQDKVGEQVPADIPPKKMEVRAEGQSADSLLVVLGEEPTRAILREGQTYHTLTRKDVARVDSTLRTFWAAGGGDSIFVSKKDAKTGRWVEDSVSVRKPLPYEKYYKQLVGYEEGGRTLVRIQLLAIVHPMPGQSPRAYLQHHLHVVRDGGIYFGDALVDLTHGKVIGFSLNGEA